MTHVAYEDAEAYAAWAGKELPTEAEWEFAARGGLEQATYIWGDEFAPKGRMMANTWQGEFPWQNLLLDRYVRHVARRSFPPNGYGLFDMAGNVWEWTVRLLHAPPSERGASIPAARPATRASLSADGSYELGSARGGHPRRVTKGGSHLCAPNYCLAIDPPPGRARPSTHRPGISGSAA